jgi:hypothetical protein
LKIVNRKNGGYFIKEIMLNIESDAEVDIDKFKQKSLIKFYGFYND